ncbi:MAG: hypothetical protein H0X37_07060 [Herpetosiphonaceae bacterium]|nr:hypothetical protein [Herpetosiphonaceae bacterium]
MKHTLVLGASVGCEDRQFGKLTRIVVDNGVANQLVVNPGLFGGPERVVPISDVTESTPEAIMLKCDESEWKAYNAFKMTTHSEEQPTLVDGLPIASAPDVNAGLADPTLIDVTTTTSTVAETAVVLTSSTKVGGDGTFHGLITDTGLPQAVLVGDQTIPFAEVSELDSTNIRLGGKAAASPSADQPTHLTNQP